MARVKTKPRSASEHLTYAEYEALPGDRWSDVSHMYKGPRSYRAHMDEPDEGTDAMTFGGLLHTAVLEPDRLLLEYVIWMTEMGNRAGKKWTDFIDQHPGQTVVREVDYMRACKVRDAVWSHPQARRILKAKGETETTIQWTDPETQRPCKARIDKLIPGGRHPSINDLKSAAEVGDLRRFRSNAARLLYHGQFGMYRDGVKEALGLDCGVNLIVAETSGAFEVAVLSFTSDELWAGSDLFHRLLEQIAECEATGKWPFRYPDTIPLDLPPWTPGFAETIEYTGEDAGEIPAGLLA